MSLLTYAKELECLGLHVFYNMDLRKIYVHIYVPPTDVLSKQLGLSKFYHLGIDQGVV